MNFNENDLLRDKTELLNLMLFKLPSAKVLHKLEFATEDQVLSTFLLPYLLTHLIAYSNLLTNLPNFN